MSIDYFGLNGKISGRDIVITVKDNHPLIRLAQALSFEDLSEIIMPDLKSTTKKGRWWMGRPLRLRIHLGAYILQQVFNKTDRQIEYDIKDNAVYQLFCGRYLVKKWHCPDHTKIEEFRSRLSPGTQQKLANHTSVIATRLGFSKPTEFDSDSTIQDANMAYPSDVSLLTKVGAMTKKVWNCLTKKIPNFQLEPISMDLKEIKSKARSCFFNKSKDLEDKNSKLQELWMSVFKQVSPVLKIIDKVLVEVDWRRMSWNIKHTTNQLKQHAHSYLVDVVIFLNRGVMATGKRLSFHLDQVSCFNKGKIKGLQFGRAFQIGRIGGNFLIVGENFFIRMDDKSSLKSMFETYQKLFEILKNFQLPLIRATFQ